MSDILEKNADFPGDFSLYQKKIENLAGEFEKIFEILQKRKR